MTIQSEAFWVEVFARPRALSCPIVLAALWFKSVTVGRAVRTSRCLTRDSQRFSHVKVKYTQDAQQRICWEDCLITRHCLLGFEELGTACLGVGEKHSRGRFHVTDGWGRRGHIPKYRGSLSNRVLETQFGQEEKQLQILHLHGNKTVGPIPVITPYKYRRCRQSKADILSSQLIL